MTRYHLHCTDGVDFVLDHEGVVIADEEDVGGVAFGSALALMRSLPKYRDWSSWVIAVHDQDGYQVEIVPFPDGRVFGDLLWQAGSIDCRAFLPVHGNAPERIAPKPRGQ